MSVDPRAAADAGRPEASAQSTGARIVSIMKLRRALASSSAYDARWFLEDFGLLDPADDTDISSMSDVTDRLRRGTIDELSALLAFFESDAVGVLRTEAQLRARLDSQDPDRPLHLFASHVSEHQEFVEDVRDQLARFGVDLFVASHSIDPETEWAEKIEIGLDAAHAGVAFLHPGFSSRPYCQQEVGWLLGRRVPVYRFRFGEDPPAMLDSRQGADAAGWTAERIADEVLQRVLEDSNLGSHLRTSLCGALRDSTSFRLTDRLWDVLPKDAPFTPDQLADLVDAAESNSQVFRAERASSGDTYRRLILDLLGSQSTPESLRERVDELATRD